MKLNTHALEVSSTAGYCGYKLGELMRRRESSALWCLPCCSFLFAFGCSQLPLLSESMDHDKHPRGEGEGAPEASDLPLHL
jgi:hypothetical protein